MLPIPTRYTPVAGHAEGASKLNAFDGALLDAGIGNMNLVRVSSILPPGAVLTEPLIVVPGMLLPTAYGSIVSDRPGELIAAAVAVGLSDDGYGVIFEHSGLFRREEAEEAVAEMAREALRVRGRPVRKVIVKGAEHRVEKIGCAFAAVALWY